MVGFALSGVTMALMRDWAVRHGPAFLPRCPGLLVLAAAGGYWGMTANPFNPLQLQNAATCAPQLGNIALYYAVLLPFFYLTGLYISLCFVLNADRVGRVYGYDLTWAGAGAALVLALMAVVHPFQLVPALLVLLAAAGLFGPPAGAPAWPAWPPWSCARACCSWQPRGVQRLQGDLRAASRAGRRQVAEVSTPRGLYTLLDDFTERVDTDLSNNAGLLGLPGPPQTSASTATATASPPWPRPGCGRAYAPATLAALPYALRPARACCWPAAAAGSAWRRRSRSGRPGDVLEPDPVVLGALRHGLGPSPALARPTRPPPARRPAGRRSGRRGSRPGGHVGRLPRRR